jgi:transcription elongation factor GreB
MHVELLTLLNEERPKVTAEVSAAAAQGDRSENAEYIYGKRRLREIDRRIRFLQRRLDTCTIVAPEEQTDTERVWFGAQVTLEDEDGTRRSYQIVGPDVDRRWRCLRASPAGPLAPRQAPGDEVTVRPRGEAEVVIRDIGTNAVLSWRYPLATAPGVQCSRRQPPRGSEHHGARPSVEAGAW